MEKMTQSILLICFSNFFLIRSSPGFELLLPLPLFSIMDLQSYMGTQAVYQDSTKGVHKMLTIGGYEYKFKYTRMKDDATVWHCCRCGISAETRNNRVTKVVNHVHNPSETAVQVRTIKNSIKKSAATSTRGKTKDVVAEALQVFYFDFSFNLIISPFRMSMTMYFRS